MDSLEATVRIIEAMLASDQCPPPFVAVKNQAVQRDTIRQDHAPIDIYREAFVVLFRTVHDSVLIAAGEATELQVN